MLIREIEGGTDSNNRKITVITICCDSRFLARGRTPAGRCCEGGATPVRRARMYYIFILYRYAYLYIIIILYITFVV